MRLPGEQGPSRRRLIVLGIAAVAVIAFLVLRSYLPEPDLQELLEDVSSTLGAWTYLIVAVFAFLETGAFIGLVAPGEVAVIFGGAVAGQGEISLVIMLGIAWAASYAGDTTGFLIGHQTGRDFLLRHGSLVGITPERFAQVEQYFQNQGGRTVLIGRFISIARPLIPFIASSSGMRYRDFAPYSVLGTGLWATTFTLLGYFGSQSVDHVAEVAGQGGFLFATFVALIVGIVLASRFLREPENRARLVAGMERRPWLRPLLRLGRRLQPGARFAKGRLTPGGLGLELTTLLAILAVGVYVLVAYTVVLSGDPGPTPGDLGALDIARDIRAGWLTDVIKVVTDLGSGGVTLSIAALAGVALIGLRRWAELGVLIGGVAIAHVAVPELKDMIDRPRPLDALEPAGSAAFPSGHAAYAVIYTWIAATVAFRITPGLALRSVLIGVGIAVTAIVGLTRVYLGVHYLSDVTAGWALGFSAFALCGVIALIFIYLRQNSAAFNARRRENRA
jgi:undecaprenyl-diphosphatase